jgi:tetratricopeptide (TPR) repeat protein
LINKRAALKDAPLQDLAALMESLDEMDAAHKIFQEIARNPKKPEDLLQYALFLGRFNRPDDGLRICEPLRKSAPPESVALVSVTLLRAKTATEAQRDEVEAWLKSVIDKTPTTNLLALWAELLDLRRRYPDAVQAWRDVLKRDPNHAVALNNLACLLAYQYAPGDEALLLIDRALNTVGHVPELLDSRALVYLSRKDAASAIDDLDQAIKRGPTASKYYHFARANLMAGKLDAAQSAWNKAVAAKLKVEDLHPLEAKDFESFPAKMRGK